jgi:hypothetical protein
MHLVGHEQTVIADTKNPAQRLAIATDSLHAVAAIAVDVKRCVVSLAVATVALAAEGHHAVTHVVIIQLRLLYHGAKVLSFF